MHPALQKTLRFSVIFFVLILIFEMINGAGEPIMLRLNRAVVTTGMIGGVYGLMMWIMHNRTSKGDGE
ncbi:MAG: hypothetical protein AB8B58_18780 [Roseobacter sp.]